MEIKKICIFSDVHGNYIALKELAKTADYKTANLRICLGDLVFMGPEPNKCVEFIKRRKIICLQGNHDEYMGSMQKNGGRRFGRPYIHKHQEYMVDNIKEKNKEYMDNLPKEYELNIAGKRLVFTHYAWKDETHILGHEVNLEKGLANVEADYIFHGHDHKPGHKVCRNKKEIINVGSVGLKYPAHYMMIEIENGKINKTQKTLEYGYERIERAFLKKKYPGNDFYLKYFYQDYTPDYYRTDTY